MAAYRQHSVQCGQQLQHTPSSVQLPEQFWQSIVTPQASGGDSWHTIPVQEGMLQQFPDVQPHEQF